MFSLRPKIAYSPAIQSRNHEIQSKKISDHFPVVHQNTLFWNVMMQAKMRVGQASIGYNNGFGIKEDEAQYARRLEQVAVVIAKIVKENPKIDVICLCEGPINQFVEPFVNKLKEFEEMKRFFFSAKTNPASDFYKPQPIIAANKNDWGLFLFVDKNIAVKATPFSSHALSVQNKEKLSNRFQIWELKQNGEKYFCALGHVPLGKDEVASEFENLSQDGKEYARFFEDILTQHKNNLLTICADFNMDPNVIEDRNKRLFDVIPRENSLKFESEILLSKKLTVDGILLSDLTKQKFFSSIPFANLSSFLFLEKYLAYQVCATAVRFGI